MSILFFVYFLGLPIRETLTELPKIIQLLQRIPQQLQKINLNVYFQQLTQEDSVLNYFHHLWSVLFKGGKFAVLPTKLSTENVIANIEYFV